METEEKVLPVVDDEALLNDIARFLHLRRHKSERTYFCASDRTFAQELLEHFIEDKQWVVVEDNRSS